MELEKVQRKALFKDELLIVIMKHKGEPMPLLILSLLILSF
jgi:hypothetical protein